MQTERERCTGCSVPTCGCVSAVFGPSGTPGIISHALGFPLARFWPACLPAACLPAWLSAWLPACL